MEASGTCHVIWIWFREWRSLEYFFTPLQRGGGEGSFLFVDGRNKWLEKLHGRLRLEKTLEI